jgi:fumarylacetoacetate (FAA) hydrolase family protein
MNDEIKSKRVSRKLHWRLIQEYGQNPAGVILLTKRKVVPVKKRKKKERSL